MSSVDRPGGSQTWMATFSSFASLPVPPPPGTGSVAVVEVPGGNDIMYEFDQDVGVWQIMAQVGGAPVGPHGSTHYKSQSDAVPLEQLGTTAADDYTYHASSGGIAVSRNNLTATSDPSVTDDSASGYSVGSYWFNTALNSIYVASDASVGAAIWKQVSNSGQQRETPGEHLLGSLLHYNQGAGAANLLQYTRLFLPAGISIDRLRFWQRSGGAVGRTVQLGLYNQTNPALDTLPPSSRVAVTAVTPTAAADDGSFVTVNLTATYVPPATGFYWVAIVLSDALVQVQVSQVYAAGYLPRVEATGAILPATAAGLSQPASACAYVAAVEV